MSPLPPNSPASTPSAPGYLQEVLAVLSAVAMVLSARILLLLSAAGAFVLAYMATQSPETGRLIATVIYDCGVLGPITYLYLKQG
jgi:hypothetical protein